MTFLDASKNFNRIEIVGNGNVVIIQNDGNKQTYSIAEAIRSITESKNEQIRLLQNTLKDKEKIEQLSEEKIKQLQEELELRDQDLQRTKQYVQEILQKVEGLYNFSSDVNYKQALELFIKGNLNGALDSLHMEDLEGEVERARSELSLKKKRLADALILKGQILDLQNEQVGSEKAYQKAIELLPDEYAYGAMAEHFVYHQNYAEAIAYYLKAYEVSDSDVSRVKLANSLGKYFYYGRAFEKAEEWLLRSIGLNRTLIAQGLGNKKGLAMSLSNLGSVYASANGLKNSGADNLFKEALAIIREDLPAADDDDQDLFAATLANFGLHYSIQGQALQAAVLFEEALVIRKGLPDTQDNRLWTARLLANLGLVNQDAEDQRVPVDYFLEAKDIYRFFFEDDPVQFFQEYISVASNLNKIYLKNQLHNEYKAAIDGLVFSLNRLLAVDPRSFSLKIAGVFFVIGCEMADRQKDTALALEKLQGALEILKGLPFDELRVYHLVMQVKDKISRLTA